MSRTVPAEVRNKHNDVAGFIGSMAGIVYAVILAFIAIAVWEAFGKAEAVVQREASTASDVWRDASPYPPEFKAKVRKGLEEYIRHYRG